MFCCHCIKYSTDVHYAYVLFTFPGWGTHCFLAIDFLTALYCFFMPLIPDPHPLKIQAPFFLIISIDDSSFIYLRELMSNNMSSLNFLSSTSKSHHNFTLILSLLSQKTLFLCLPELCLHLSFIFSFPLRLFFFCLFNMSLSISPLTVAKKKCLNLSSKTFLDSHVATMLLSSASLPLLTLLHPFSIFLKAFHLKLVNNLLIIKSKGLFLFFTFLGP